MKTSKIVIIILGILSLSCVRESIEIQKQPVIIYGKIDINEELNSFIVSKRDLITDEDELSLIKFDSSRLFNYAIDINYPQAIHLMIENNRQLNLLVFPGDSIQLNYCDTINITYSNKEHQSFNKIITYIENEIQTISTNACNPMFFRKADEKQFKSRIDSIRNSLHTKLRTYIKSHVVSKEMIVLAKNEIDFYVVSSLEEYELFNNYVFKQKCNLPDFYYSLVDSLSIKWEDICCTSRVENFFNYSPIRFNTDNECKSILNLPKSKLRDLLLSKILIYDVCYGNHIGKRIFYDKYSSEIENNDIRKLFNNKFENAYEIHSNPLLTSAKLKRITHTSETSFLDELINQHPNKVLYIKFWTPSCKPCMMQAPFVKELEKKFSPKEFEVINLCALCTKKDWKTTIKNKNMSGIHYLLTKDQYNDLKVTLNIQSLPAYCLINKRGEVVDKKALEPCDIIMENLNYELVSQIKEIL